MLIRGLATKYKTAQIITHNDLDGYGAGAILVKTLTTLGFNIDDIVVTHTDYTNAFPVDERFNLVFLSDISISNVQDAKKLLAYASKPDNIVFWFDHHKTSIGMYHYYPELRDIPGIRDTNASGAMLCWIFLQIVASHESIEDVFTELATVDVRSIMQSDTPGIYKQIKNDTIAARTPIGIILTDDYDRFVLNEKMSVYYNEAFYSYPEFEKDCKSKYFQDKYVSLLDNRHLEFSVLGKKIFLWKRIFALNSLKTNGFIASLPIEGMKDIEMVCINSTNKGSMLFGRCLGDNSNDKYLQYNYACVYSSKGEKTTVSIYCANPDTSWKENRQIGKIYDASDICKRMGGGGHPGAAGYVIDQVNFCGIKPLPTKILLQIDEEILEIMHEVECL